MRLRRSHRLALAALALFGAAAWLAIVWAQGPTASAQASLALLPAGLLLAVPWWRQRITLDADCITVTSGFGRTRVCHRADLAAWATRTLDPLMPSVYLDLYVASQSDRFVLSVPLSPLDERDRAQLLSWAQAATNQALSQPDSAC